MRGGLRQWDVPTALPQLKPLPKVGYSVYHARDFERLHTRTHLPLWLQHSAPRVAPYRGVSSSSEHGATPLIYNPAAALAL